MINLENDLYLQYVKEDNIPMIFLGSHYRHIHLPKILVFVTQNVDSIKWLTENKNKKFKSHRELVAILAEEVQDARQTFANIEMAVEAAYKAQKAKHGITDNDSNNVEDDLPF